MGKFERDFRQIERSLTKLGATPRQTAAFRKQLAKGLLEVATENEDEIVEHLVNEGKAGWVKDPRKGVAVLVERGTGCVLLDSAGKEFANPTFTHPRTAPVDKGKLVSHLKRPEIERYVPWMYLDSEGNVTVGIGHKIRDIDEARRLPFLERGTTQGAHSTHKENAYRLVLRYPHLAGKADKFKPLTHIDISEADATTIALNDIDQKIREITAQAAFPDYDTYPPTAKLGLLDMAFNVGVAKIFAPAELKGFPKFRAAVFHRNWKLAAQQSHREGISDERNRQVRKWFLRAAVEESFFIDPGCKKSLKVELR